MQSFAFTHLSSSHGECHPCETPEMNKRGQLAVKLRAGICYYNFSLVLSHCSSLGVLGYLFNAYIVQVGHSLS